MLPENDVIQLDKNNSNEVQLIMYTNVNVVAMKLLTVMLWDTNAMIMLIDSTKTEDWPIV
jgi:hypothetical protein